MYLKEDHSENYQTTELPSVLRIAAVANSEDPASRHAMQLPANLSIKVFVKQRNDESATSRRQTSEKWLNSISIDVPESNPDP